MVDITVSDFMKGRYNLMIYVGIDIAKRGLLPLPYPQMAKYSLSRSNSQMTMMASICCSPNWILLIPTASSLVLSQRHTTVTTLFVF